MLNAGNKQLVHTNIIAILNVFNLNKKDIKPGHYLISTSANLPAIFSPSIAALTIPPA